MSDKGFDSCYMACLPNDHSQAIAVTRYGDLNDPVERQRLNKTLDGWIARGYEPVRTRVSNAVAAMNRYHQYKKDKEICSTLFGID